MKETTAELQRILGLLTDAGARAIIARLIETEKAEDEAEKDFPYRQGVQN